MLELKTYSYTELAEYMNCRNKQALNRKLRSYDIEYTADGNRAPNIKYTITAINEPFKTYCVFDLGFDPRVEIDKLRHFLYHYFCDDVFMSMPDEVKEGWMERYEKPISRQTIANYEQRLNALEYIHRSNTEYLYYFAYHGQQRMVSKAEYSEAWRSYWEMRKAGSYSGVAITQMILDYGGVARKQAIQEKNALHTEEINFLVNLTVASIEADVKK